VFNNVDGGVDTFLTALSPRIGRANALFKLLCFTR